jgi:proton-coupled amino acid transporter
MIFLFFFWSKIKVLLQVIKVSFSAAIFITYNLAFYVSINVLWPAVLNSSEYLQSLSADQTNKDDTFLTPKRKLTLIENLFRMAVVAVTFLLPISIPKIDLFINLVGAVPSSTLNIIFPAILDIAVFWRKDKSITRLIKNVLILVFGVFILISGTIVSLKDIIDYYKHF